LQRVCDEMREGNRSPPIKRAGGATTRLEELTAAFP
jgi:hypothetical protein